MTTDIAAASMSGALAVRGDQPDWTPVQQAAFAHIGIEDAPDADKQVFHYVCQNTGLDPFRRQIYMIKRSERGKDKWTIQTGIDGFRLIAEDHPQYAGTLDPEWCGPDGVWRETWTEPRPPVMARVKVLRRDRAHPISLPVRFNEFAATFSDGNLQGQWRTKPAHMIAKVAEAASLRKAFPRQLAGVYTDDEMAGVDRQHGGSAAGHASPTPPDTPIRASDLTTRPADARPLAEHVTTTSTEPEVVEASTVESDVVEAETIDDPPQTDDRMSREQQGKLFALLRETDIEDRWDWASGILGREVTSYGQLSSRDASRLIDSLTTGGQS